MDVTAASPNLLPSFSDVLSHGVVRRGGRTVLEAARIEVPTNCVIGLVGINGAGKSTLMLELAGVLNGGRRATDCCAFSPQAPHFPEWLDTFEIVRMFGGDYDQIMAEYPSLLLEEIGRTRGDRLSNGQAQSLSLAIALSLRAPVTLLDEPFAPLDFRRRIALTEILRQRACEVDGGILMVSSQSAAEMLDVCGWLVVLNRGRNVFSGAISEITHGADSHEHARALLEAHVLSLLD